MELSSRVAILGLTLPQLPSNTTPRTLYVGRDGFGMRKETLSTFLEIAPYRYSSTWLIGATTHAIDRFVADVERIYQPEREHIGGSISFDLSNEIVTISPRERVSRKMRLMNRIRPPRPIHLDDAVFFDARENEYFNWSHQVNFFLTLALAARSAIEEPITIVLPDRMPNAASDLYRQFRFGVVSTDGPVTGCHCAWSVSDNEAVASGRQQLIAPFMQQHGDDPIVFPVFELPDKVFLSRRGTRSLINEDEVEALLGAYGFVKVYAEDLSVPEQFALLRQAAQIVAIHGAGLAPLQYRSLTAPSFQLIELAPVGIMTRWFGMMCEQVGGSYISVRGRIKPEYVNQLYQPEPFLSHCDDRFSIDPRSLEVALALISAT